MENTNLLGMDIGYGNICVASGDSNQPQLSIYPVGVKKAVKETILTLQQTEAVEVLVGDESFFALIDPAKVPMSARSLSNDFITSKNYEALYSAVLSLSNKGTIDHLVTGLPVTQYKDQKIKLALEKKLSGIRKVSKNSQVIVKKVNVVPQPYGAYLDALNQPKYSELFGEADVLVIDPGFFSVDWISVYRYDIQMEFSGSSATATSRILEEAKKMIEAENGGRINTERIESALREGSDTVLLGGVRFDFLPFLNKAAEMVAPQVLEEIISSMRDKKYDVDFVILAGGAASLYEKAVRDRFARSQIITLENSVMANVRGFHTFALASQG